MDMIEDPRFTADFSDPARRSSAAGIEVRFKDGSRTRRIDVEYPSGHPSRRHEAAAAFQRKFTDALARQFPQQRIERIARICADPAAFDAMPVNAFMDLLALD